MGCRLRAFRHFARALIALLLLAVGLEVVLRVQDARTETLRETKNEAVIVPCWSTHHRLRPLQTFRWGGDDGSPLREITTNSFGLRGPEPVVPKPPGVYRIVCLGDERLAELDVPESETFCQRLGRLLEPHTRLEVEVINAGVPGYCPLLSYLQVRRELLALDPDLLLLNFDFGDVAEDYRYRRHTLMDAAGAPLGCPHPTLVAGHPPSTGPWIEHCFIARWCRRRVGGAWKETAVPDAEEGIGVPSARYAWLGDDPPDWSVHIQHALSSVGQLNALADGSFARMVLIVCPVAWQVSPEAGQEIRNRFGVSPGAVYRSRRPFEILAEYAASQDIPFCDTSSAFLAAPKPERLFRDDAVGLSEAGRELYAGEAAQFLLSHIPGVWTNQSRRLPARLSSAASMRPHEPVMAGRRFP